MNNREGLIKQQFQELVEKYPNLKLSKDNSDQWVIRGKLSFSASFKDDFQQNASIMDTYSVMIILPNDYPLSPPFVQETGGRIPADFHQYPDRTLCLGIPIEVKQRFKKEPTLLAFVEKLLIPYLYSHSYFEKYGRLPFGEFSHGGKGIREYYQELFNTDDIYIVMELLKIMAEGKYRGHHQCPCGSGKNLRKCHGQRMLELVKGYSNEIFLKDLLYIFITLEDEERKYLFKEKKFTIPKTLQRKLDEILENNQEENK